MIVVPESALGFGFGNAPGGTQSRRTIMLAELRVLLANCPPDAVASDYRAAAVAENALLKPTVEARQTAFEVLVARYGLDPKVPLFQVLRRLWDADAAAQPLLALLCAAARDPMLRATAEVILPMRVGDEVRAPDLAKAIAGAFPERFGETTLAVAGRFAASSWAQGGLLAGKNPKVRADPAARPVALAYALLLGHLCGARGDSLFQSLWAQIVDTRPHRLRDLALEASRLGWIDLRSAGGVTEVGFTHLLGDREVRA